MLFLSLTTGAPNEGSQTARRISESKMTAAGKGLKVMCLEGEAYVHAYVCICMAWNIGGLNMASLPPKRR